MINIAQQISNRNNKRCRRRVPTWYATVHFDSFNTPY